MSYNLLRVELLGSKVWGLRLRVSGLELGVKDLGVKMLHRDSLIARRLPESHASRVTT